MKKFIIGIFILIPVLSIGSLLFYWYQIRPAQIKHECSWVKRHADATPGRPSMTRSELEAKRIIRTCKNEYELVNKIAPDFDLQVNKIPPLLNSKYTFEQTHAIWDATSCREDSDKVIADYKKEIKAIPAKDWYEAATKDEYNFCLHDKGL